MARVTATSPLDLPRVKRPVNEEIAAARKVIEGLKDYQAKGWGIGLNGDTFTPDSFLSFFTQRQLPFDYYVVNYGVSIGGPEAYQTNIDTLNQYITLLCTCETASIKKTIQELKDYQNRFWGIGLNGDTLKPDGFNPFFAVRGLPFKPFVRSTSGISIGQQSAYDENIATLGKYLNGMDCTPDPTVTIPPVCINCPPGTPSVVVSPPPTVDPPVDPVVDPPVGPIVDPPVDPKEPGIPPTSSGYSDCLPEIEVPANKEVKSINETIKNLKGYEAKGWGFGISGGDFTPDGFMTFFTQRNLPLEPYAVNFGVTIGSPANYGKAFKTLEDYKKAVIAKETEKVTEAIGNLEMYRDKFWGIGLNGDTLEPDGFNTFFAERELPFKPFVRSTTGISIGEQSAYDENIATLRKYLGELK